MTKKPIIGISGSLIADQSGTWAGYERAYVNDDYIQAVIRAGGIPFILPLSESEEVIRAQLNGIDGLIMSGGQDVNPLLYDEEPDQKLGEICPKRDYFDTLLIQIAMANRIPLLGICRGMQLLNVVNGGSLYQDLSAIEGCYVKHVQGHLPSTPTHHIHILEHTKLHGIFGAEIVANSFHHLAVKALAPGFVISARAKDGVVEAIESEGETFVIGVQWHPEMMSKDHANMRDLFNRLIDEASAYNKLNL